MKRIPADDSLRCSFCRKRQEDVGRLISSPSDYPRAYICDECIAVCATIIEDNSQEETGTFMDHPQAPELMEALQTWVDLETRARDSREALAEVRRLAMLVLPYSP